LYLRDLTGNRRFWPIACGKIDMDWVVDHRDQLYAEAKARLDAGSQWWVDDRLTTAVLDARVAQDPWEHVIETVLHSIVQTPALVLGNIPYHFAPSEVILGAIILNGNSHAGHYQRLHGLMKKVHPGWEPFRYDNVQKPFVVNGVPRTSVRGFRCPIVSVAIGSTPLPVATVTTLNSKLMGPQPDGTAVTGDNPFQ
jgi:hypothetical protein